ncbi:MAG: tetratricopeptide repeat protein [Planctomycetota bacterium]
MRLTGWRFLVFALAGAGAIVLLSSVGTPGRKEVTIDRHTGERLVVVRNVAEALAEARDTGNVRKALEALRPRLEQFPGEPVLERTEAIFVAELSDDPDAPPPAAHPEADVLAAERRRARDQRHVLDRRVRERLPRESLLAMLYDLEGDSAVGAATEEFFAPLARWRPEYEQGPERPDEMAARTLARLEDPAEPLEPETFLGLIRAYRAQGRPRARMRWLLRAYGAFPESKEIRGLLVEAYLERGRVREAFVLAGTALADAPDDLELWEQRARMAGWISLPELEIEARELLIAREETPEAHERLLTLYEYVGKPGKAVPHALALARGSDDPKALERPALLALEDGQVDLAFRILDDLAKASDDPAYWREKIVKHAWDNGDDVRVVHELELLRERYPERDYERRLETVYRQRDMNEELVSLLEERLARGPHSDELEEDIINLHISLGNDDRLRTVLHRRIERTTDPRHFFVHLATYHGRDIPDLEEHARKHAASPQLAAADVGLVLGALDPLLEEPAYRDIASGIARRFPNEPRARAFLLMLVDQNPTDAARARAAEKLAHALPDHPDYLAAWIERASWARNVESEIAGRELWRERARDDYGNLRRLVALYAAAQRREDAVVVWRRLAKHDGLESEATLHLIDALFAVEEYEEAVAWLEKRAALPGATVEDRLHVAEQLFGQQYFDRALRFYGAVLDVEQDHPVALLRTGQIRSWTNDPRGAIPFLERRLKVTDEERAEIRYLLGEAHWSIYEDEKGRRYHEQALEELRARPELTVQQQVMVAKMLARFGRIEEAQPIFERVVDALPEDVDLLLDYADSMLAHRDVPKARELVEEAKTLEKRQARTMTAEGKVLLLEKNYEQAAAVLTNVIAQYGADAGTQSELGRARELAGEWRPASEAYRHSLTLQPDNRDTSRALQRVLDEVAPLLHASASFRAAGDDRVFELWAQGSKPLRNERLRLSAALGASWFSGRAAAVNNGNTDVDEFVGRGRLSAAWRFRRENHLTGGVEVYPGAPGDTPVGGWAGLFAVGHEPYRSLAVDLHAHLLMENPPAAVGLGGRRSGVRVALHRDIGKRFWAAVELAYDSLSLETPSARDGLFRGAATFGWRIAGQNAQVAEQLRLDRSALAGLVGTHVAGQPGGQAGRLVTLWATYEPFRLLDDRELAALIPIGERFDYVRLGARGDFQLARGWGAKVSGWAGYDLYGDEPNFGVEAGVTWRPAHKLELTGMAGYGTALGRSDAADSFLVRLGLTYRW